MTLELYTRIVLVRSYSGVRACCTPLRPRPWTRLHSVYICCAWRADAMRSAASSSAPHALHQARMSSSLGWDLPLCNRLTFEPCQPVSFASCCPVRPASARRPSSSLDIWSGRLGIRLPSASRIAPVVRCSLLLIVSE